MEASAEHELGFFEAHRNDSCNESKTDMLAGAATSEQFACMTQNPTKIVSQTPKYDNLIFSGPPQMCNPGVNRHSGMPDG